jgi:hypothetical protein
MSNLNHNWENSKMTLYQCLQATLPYSDSASRPTCKERRPKGERVMVRERQKERRDRKENDRGQGPDRQ